MVLFISYLWCRINTWTCGFRTKNACRSAARLAFCTIRELDEFVLNFCCTSILKCSIRYPPVVTTSTLPPCHQLRSASSTLRRTPSILPKKNNVSRAYATAYHQEFRLNPAARFCCCCCCHPIICCLRDFVRTTDRWCSRPNVSKRFSRMVWILGQSWMGNRHDENSDLQLSLTHNLPANSCCKDGGELWGLVNLAFWWLLLALWILFYGFFCFFSITCCPPVVLINSTSLQSAVIYQVDNK